MLPLRRQFPSNETTFTFILPNSGLTIELPVCCAPDNFDDHKRNLVREKIWRHYLKAFLVKQFPGTPVPPDPELSLSEQIRDIASMLSQLALRNEAQGPTMFNLGASDETLAQVDKMCATIEDLTRAVNAGVNVEHGISNPFPQLTGLAGEVLGPLMNYLDPQGPSFKTTIFIGIIIYFAWLVQRPSRLASFPMAALSIVLVFYLGSEIGPSLLEWCKGFFLQDEDEIVPQMGAATLVPLITTFIYGQCGYRSYEKGCINDFIKTIAMVPKQADGVKYLVEFVLTTMQSCANYFTDKLGMDPLVFKQSMVPELDDIYARVQKIIIQLRAGADYNYDTAQVVFDIERDLNSCIGSIPRTRDYEVYRRQAQEIHSKVKELVVKMERNNVVGNGPRREPLGIMLGGPTGVGKSTTTVPYILATMASILPKTELPKFIKNHNDLIWNYIPENPFHDAYHGQPATVVDEVGSQREAVGCPDAGTLGLMRMINTANFPLHMAHLDDKGNCNFRSELVIATTNRQEFDNKSMWFPEAFSRRFLISLLVVPKEEYCKEGTVTSNLWDRRLDTDKLPYAEKGIVDNVNEFYPYSFLHGERRVTGPPMTFDELVEKTVSIYMNKKNKGDKVLEYHAAIKEKYLAMRPDAQGATFSSNPYDKSGLTMDPEADDSDDDIFFDDEQDMRSYLSSAPWPQRLFHKVAPHISASSSSSHVEKLLKDKFVDSLELVCIGLNKLVSIHKKHPYLSALIVAVPAMLLGWKLIYPMIFAQSGENRKMGTKGKRPRVSKPLSVARVSEDGLLSQANINQNSLDIASKISRGSTYVVTWHGKKFGYLTFLKGRVGIMPEHFLYAIESSIEDNGFSPTDPVEFRRAGALESGFSARFCDIEFLDDDTTRDDTTFVRFKSECHIHPDITKYIPKEGTIKLDARFDCALLRPCDGAYSLVTSDAWVVGATVYSDYSFDNGFSYNIPTQVGDCGAILFGLSHSGIPYITGMHVSGNGKVGYSTSIRKETVDHVLRVWKDRVTVPFDESPEPIAQVGEGFLSTHVVPKLRSPEKSKIIKSPLHGKWRPSICAIGKLRSFKLDGQIIDPMTKAREKYNKPRPAYNLPLLDMCADTVVQDVIYASDSGRPWEARLLTYEEAIIGVDGVDYIDSIKRNTSPGFPFINMVKAPGKTHWFGADVDFKLDSKEALELKANVMNQLAEIRRGKRLGYVFADFLKDQRLEAAKAEVGKARLVSCSPIDFLILCRMYFGDLVRWIMSNRIRNGYAIGVNNFSMEWTSLANHLVSVGHDNIICGDYSAYDGSLSPSLMYTFEKLADAFYGDCDPMDTVVRSVLFECIVNSRHVFSTDSPHESIVYEWFGGNPSGNFLTTILNTHCNLVLIRYSLVSCRLAYEGRMHLDAFDYSMCEMVRFVQNESRTIAFGDDNGISVSDALKVYVTPTALTKAMADVGFKYTNETKSGDNVEFRTLDQCTFLKRGFFWHDKMKRYLSPLDINVILEMPYWTRLGVPADHLVSVVDDAIMELSAHGPEVYNKWAPAICQASVTSLRHSPKVSHTVSLEKFVHQQVMYT